MKKFLIAILAFLYISTSTGATLHVHYCMGELADWGLGQYDSRNCSKCGMDEAQEKEKGCCKNENKFFKNNSDQKISESARPLLQLITITLPPAFIELPLNAFPFIAEVNPINNAPPRNNGIAIYIHIRVFLL